MSVQKIISGGQTGVDRAALDMAIALGIPHGGTVPKGRLAEDGPLPQRYNVTENSSTDVSVRTRQNVIDADATLIFVFGALAGGTLLTKQIADSSGKPCTVVDIETGPVDRVATSVRAWLRVTRPITLNIAGPRESENPGIIYARSLTLLSLIFGPGTLDDYAASITALREQCLSQIHHWDQIRWLVPGWYSTLMATAMALPAIGWVNVSEPKFRICSGVFAAFGIVCLRLMWNLQRYHHNAVNAYNEMVDRVRLEAALGEAFRIRLQYDFTTWRYWLTATALLFMVVLIMTIALGCIAVFGQYLR